MKSFIHTENKRFKTKGVTNIFEYTNSQKAIRDHV